MPDQPSPQPPKPTRPTLQVAATPVPEGAAPAEQSPANPIGTTISPPFDPALAALVEGAKADLAARRAAALDTIAVVEVRSVTWPDPGLGCPRPDMAYKQVPVDGLLIRLSAGGSVFNYHSGGGKPPFLCEQPAQDHPPPGSGGGGDH